MPQLLRGKWDSTRWLAILVLYISLLDARLDDDGETKRSYISFPRVLLVFSGY